MRVCVSRLGLHVAVKLLKSGDGFTQAGQDELALLQCVSDRFVFLSPSTLNVTFYLLLTTLLNHQTFSDPPRRLPSSLCVFTLQASGPTSRHPFSRRVVQLLDEFKVAGVNGVRILFHICRHNKILERECIIKIWQTWGRHAQTSSKHLNINITCKML